MLCKVDFRCETEREKGVCFYFIFLSSFLVFPSQSYDLFVVG